MTLDQGDLDRSELFSFPIFLRVVLSLPVADADA